MENETGRFQKATDFFTSFGRGRATKKHIYHFCGDFLFGEKTRERLPGPQGPWFFHQTSWPGIPLKKCPYVALVKTLKILPEKIKSQEAFPLTFPKAFLCANLRDHYMFNPNDALNYRQINAKLPSLRILGMSWGVKNTFFEAPGVSLGGSGVSIGGVKILRDTYMYCLISPKLGSLMIPVRLWPKIANVHWRSYVSPHGVRNASELHGC